VLVPKEATTNRKTQVRRLIIADIHPVRWLTDRKSSVILSSLMKPLNTSPLAVCLDRERLLNKVKCGCCGLVLDGYLIRRTDPLETLWSQ
jgi:hypothetical protein